MVSSMKRFPCNPTRPFRRWMAGCLLILTLIPMGSIIAQDKNLRLNKAADRIAIRADKLIADNATRLIEMIGNVEAVRGAMKIQADRLKVVPLETSPAKKRQASFKDSVNKVVANGNVRITYGEFIATADQAVYSAHKETIVLTGNPSKVTRGDQSMTAKQMILFVEDERVRVSGQGQQRVKAVFNK